MTASGRYKSKIRAAMRLRAISQGRRVRRHPRPPGDPDPRAQIPLAGLSNAVDSVGRWYPTRRF